MPQFKNASVQKILNEITAKKGWFEVDEFWTIKFNPLTAIFDGLSYVIKQLEVPEKYWNVEKQDYNPILYYVSQVDPTSMSVFVSDQVLQQYGVSGYASKVLFAAKCGVWNGLVGQVAGLTDTAGLLSDLLTGGDRLGQVWEGVKKLDIFCTSSTNGDVCIWTIIKKAHQGNKYQVSHQIGKDISEVLTIVVSFAKAGKLAKISQVADALDPVNYVMRVSGKVIQPVLSATGKTFKFVLKEGVDFVKRLNVKVTPQGFGCGFPIVKINVTLKSKIDNLTDAQLKTKVEAEINTQGGIDKLPVDENGNHLVEIEIDGEKVTTIIGEDANLDKLGSEVVSDAGNDITTLLLNSGEDFTVLTNARKLPDPAVGNGKNITGTWLRGTERNAGLFPKSVADKLKGKSFKSFDDFRQQFWKAVAEEPNLASQFDANSIQRMQSGLAPFTNVSQQIGGMKNYVLHHKTPINQGGAVYDMDNLYIVTPRYHKEILNPAYHYGYGY